MRHPNDAREKSSTLLWEPKTMLTAILLSLIAIPMCISGVLFLAGKQQKLFLKSEIPHTPIRRTDRIAIGLTCSFVGMLLIATAYAAYIGEPFWFLEKVFGLMTQLEIK